MDTQKSIVILNREGSGIKGIVELTEEQIKLTDKLFFETLNATFDFESDDVTEINAKGTIDNEQFNFSCKSNMDTLRTTISCDANVNYAEQLTNLLLSYEFKCLIVNEVCAV